MPEPPPPPQLPAPPLARPRPIRSARRSAPPAHWRSRSPGAAAMATRARAVQDGRRAGRRARLAHPLLPPTARRLGRRAPAAPAAASLHLRLLQPPRTQRRPGRAAGGLQAAARGVGGRGSLVGRSRCWIRAGLASPPPLWALRTAGGHGASRCC